MTIFKYHAILILHWYKILKGTQKNVKKMLNVKLV